VVASCELELNHVTYGGGHGVGEVLEGVVGWGDADDVDGRLGWHRGGGGGLCFGLLDMIWREEGKGIPKALPMLMADKRSVEICILNMVRGFWFSKTNVKK
jgi:hypothetical protein